MKYYALFLILFGFATFTSSCRREEEDALNDGEELTEMSADGSLYFNETEQIFTDVSTALHGSGLGKTTQIDGASVNDSTFIGFKRIVITYTGQNASGTRTRTGTASIQLISGNQWSDQGSVAQVEFNNVRTFYTTGGNSVIVNGTYFVRNVTGGRAFTDALVTHKVWGQGFSTFGSGATNTWYLNRLRTFTNSGGVFGISSLGDTTVNGKNNTLIWGTNRKGNTFWVQTEQPMVFSSLCPGKLMGGKKKYSGLAAEFTVTHAINQDGTPNTSGCAYGYRVDWENRKGEARNAIISY